MAGEPNEVVWRGVRPVSGIRGIWPARDSVRVSPQGSVFAVGVTIIYTVPAGKLLFISGVNLGTGLSADANVRAFVAVRNAADVFQYGLIYHRFVKAGQLNSFPFFSPALEASAGWDAYLNSDSANLSSTCYMFGWLEDA